MINMKKNKKQILKETISFIAALSFIASSNLYEISVIADTQTEAEISVSSAKEENIVEDSKTTINKNITRERNITFNVIDSEQIIENIFQFVSPIFTNIFFKNIYEGKCGDTCRISINDKNDFGVVYVDEGADLNSFINYIEINEGKDKIVALPEKVIYKVDIDEDEEKCDFVAYYACSVPENMLSVSVENEEDIIEYNGVRYYKYNTNLFITPKLGWNYEYYGSEPLTYQCISYIDFKLITENNDNALIIVNNQVPKTYYIWKDSMDYCGNIRLKKSYFNINLKADKYVSNCRFRDNTIRNGVNKYNWNITEDDSKQSLITFDIPEDRNVYQVTVNGELQKIDNNSVDLTNILTNDVNRDKVIDICIKTNPKTYQAVIKNEDGNDLVKVIYDVENGLINIPYFKTIDNVLYRLQSCGYGKDLNIIETNTIIEEIKNNNLYRAIEFHEYNQLSVAYTKVLASEDKMIDQYTIGVNYSENVHYQNNDIIKYRNRKCYSTSEIKTEFMKIADSEIEQYCGYDIVQESKNNVLSQIIKSSFGNENLYIFEDYKKPITKLISINLLHSQDSELYSDFSEPVNVYYDKHAPNLKITKLHTPYAGSDVNGVYSFDFTVNDREEAHEGASDEIKKIYSEIINAPTENLTEISSITIGEYKFTNNNGSWEKECIAKVEESESEEEQKKTEDALPKYDVKLVHNEGESFTAYIEIKPEARKKGMTGMKTDIPVFAEDICGNVSTNIDGNINEITGNSQSHSGVPVNIDVDSPTLPKLTVSGVRVFDKNKERNDVHFYEKNIYAVKQIGKELRVEAFAEDKSSSIDEARTKIFYVYDDNIAEFSRRERGVYVLDCSKLKNTSGYIKLVAYDVFGNKSEFYYSSGMPGALFGYDDIISCDYFTEADRATSIIIDTALPEADVQIRNAKRYEYINKDKYNDSDCLSFTKNDGKTWYNKYPDITISAYDTDYNCSELEKISVSIGGQITDIFSDKFDKEKLKAGKYFIHFEAKENKSEYTATLHSEDGAEIELCDGKLSEDGKLEVSITAYDRAGNVSKTDSLSAYIDNTAPHSDTGFTIKDNSDVRIMRFGTFSNKKLNINVNVSDDAPSSGLSTAVLTFAGKNYEDHDIRTGIAEFTVPDSITAKAVKAEDIKITVYDNVGNKYISENLVSPEKSSTVIVETNAPEISSPVIEGENKFIKDGQKWYSSDVTVTYNVNEPDDNGSGIALINGWFIKDGVRYADSRLHNKIFTGLASGTLQTEADDKNAVYSDKIKLSTLEDADGDYTFFAETFDNAGNRSEKSVTVYKDNTKPIITGFVYGEDKKEAPIVKLLKTITKTELRSIVFGHFIQNETTVTVIANDVNVGKEKKAASSGIDSICFVMLDDNDEVLNEYIASGDDLRYEPGTAAYSADFTIPQDFKGTFAAYATDNVCNQSVCAYAEGMIVENAQKHSETSSLDIELPQTEYTDIEGFPLYKAPFTAKLSVGDTFSGLEESEIIISENNTNLTKKISVDKDGTLNGDENESWNITGSDRNLTTGISREILCENNSNGNSIKLSLRDNCSNLSETEDKVYSIDLTAPVINVSFGGASPDRSYTNIYNGTRTVSIDINERNFDPALVSVEGIHELSDWSLVSGIKGTDSAVYRATAEFKEDGKYSFTVKCKDRCDNEAAEYKSEEFIIDTVAPALNVVYDNNSSRNGNYYSAFRTAVVRITEANFDPTRINITAADLLSETNKPVISQWEEIDGAYQITVAFKNDGRYIFEVTGSDKAGNMMNAFSDTFFIDTQKPDIKISGIKSANKGDVRPVITFSDKYLDRDTVKLTLNGAERGKNIELKGEFRSTENGCIFTAENFIKEKEFDDVYTLIAEVSDNAGNVTRKEQIFSVNRFGSNFIFDEKTEKIKNRYINEPQDIIIYEISADKHDEEPMLLVIKNADNKKLEKDVDYALECTGGNGSWYQYKYTIFAENFNVDAAYAVEIYTHDEAGNNNISVTEEKGAELLFGIDRMPPLCTAIDFESNGSYKANVKKAHAIIDDNIIIKGVEVYLNGEMIDCKLNGDKCEFSIPNSKLPQTVKLTVYDMADNAGEYVYDNILVSTNFVRVIVHETWFRIAAVAAVIASIASAVYIRARQKKKIEEFLQGKRTLTKRFGK